MPTHDGPIINPPHPPVLKLVPPASKVILDGFTDVPEDVKQALLKRTRVQAMEVPGEDVQMPSIVWASSLPEGAKLVLDPSGNPWRSSSGSLNNFYEELKRRGPSPEECLEQIDDPSKPTPGLSRSEFESVELLFARMGDQELLLVPVEQLGLRRSTVAKATPTSAMSSAANAIETRAEYPQESFALVSFGERSDHSFYQKTMALVASRVNKFLNDLSNFGHSN